MTSVSMRFISACTLSQKHNMLHSLFLAPYMFPFTWSQLIVCQQPLREIRQSIMHAFLHRSIMMEKKTTIPKLHANGQAYSKCQSSFCFHKLIIVVLHEASYPCSIDANHQIIHGPDVLDKASSHFHAQNPSCILSCTEASWWTSQVHKIHAKLPDYSKYSWSWCFGQSKFPITYTELKVCKPY